MGGVRLNGEGKGQMDGSGVILDGGHGRRAGETAQAAPGFTRTRNNDCVYIVPRVHLGKVGLVDLRRQRRDGFSIAAAIVVLR